MWKAAAVPTTYRVTPSEPTIDAAAAQALALVSCAHDVEGAITRSTPRGFCGCAAGQICKPKEDGTARVLAALHDTEDEVDTIGRVLPAVQDAHAPEQAELVRPALSPYVPAGQGEHAHAPAVE